MRTRVVWNLAVCLLVYPALTLAAETLQCPPGWTQEGSVREYTPETLFEYMNGNAEGYLIYGFQKMNGISCSRDEMQLHIDISTMDSPKAAWGLFASNRDPRQPVLPLGMAGQVLSSRAIFAKGTQFVEFAIEPSGDHRELLGRLAADWSDRLSGETAPPQELGWFPENGLEPESIRLVPSSVLGISQLRRGFVADYESGMRAFVDEEDSVEAARKVMQELSERFSVQQTAQVADESFLASDRYLGEMCIFRKVNRIAGVVKAESPSKATEFASRFAERLP